jgi:hypothetical protein
MANSLFQWLALRGRLARPIAPVRNFSERGVSPANLVTIACELS